MAGSVYLIQDGGSLVETKEQPYDSEDLFQRLLAQYPSVLAGDQFGSGTPRRWLLITREIAVPSEEGAEDVGPSTISSWIKTGSPPWSRSSGAATPGFGAR
jgi:hypothetical protein